jgi:excinuclease ABC subunit A
MSSYAKRFVGQLKKPDVDFVNGLSPVVLIDQKTIASNPRSTVGTMTYVSDYLRMLFATVGQPHCPYCEKKVPVKTAYQMMERLLSLPDGTHVEVRAPVFKIFGEDYEHTLEQIRINGYRRARINGKAADLGDIIELDENTTHRIEAIVDQFVIGRGIDKQVITSLEHGLKLGDGLLVFEITSRLSKAKKDKFYKGLGCPKDHLGSQSQCMRLIGTVNHTRINESRDVIDMLSGVSGARFGVVNRAIEWELFGNIQRSLF